MIKIKVRTYHDEKWKVLYQQEITREKFDSTPRTTRVDGFYEIQCFDGEVMIESIYTVNPFIFD